MEKYSFDMEHVNTCPKCKSDNVGRRFSNVEDTEDYNMHYDTLKCNSCGYWDFPEAFYREIIETDKSEVCPKCGVVGKIALYSHDWYAGTIELICECGHVDDIENFVGKERWETFIEDERKFREAEIERDVQLMMEMGDY